MHHGTMAQPEVLGQRLASGHLPGIEKTRSGSEVERAHLRRESGAKAVRIGRGRARRSAASRSREDGPCPSTARFEARTGPAAAPCSATRISTSQAIGEACARIFDRGVHALRHSCGTRMARELGLAAAQHNPGHANLATI